jgi:hypothetical protein
LADIAPGRTSFLNRVAGFPACRRTILAGELNELTTVQAFLLAVEVRVIVGMKRSFPEPAGGPGNAAGTVAL